MLSLNPGGYQLILASQSPRRKELLEKLGYRFRQIAKDVDESYPHDLEVDQIAEYLSQKKAKAYESELASNDLLITSDTIVCIGNQVLGKASNADQAKEMLNLLSAKQHTVISGVTLSSISKSVSFSVHTQVQMKALSSDEIEFYIDNFKPYDKAGAYGIQEWIGFIGVDEIKGSFYNVMGLPVKELYEAIVRF